MPVPLKAEPDRVIGAAPAGAADEASAAHAVQQMFDEISPRYDLLNHVLSMNVDRYWWWRTARTFRSTLQRPGSRVLDLCCGTGDMATALRRQGPAAEIVGADFSRGMLSRGMRKFHSRNVVPVEADALRLPFADESFDLAVSAFGFRNLANYETGLREIYRVLRPDGELGILDFNEPSGLFGKVYRFYFRNILPKIGTMISGVRGPYSYLPASVARFPGPSEMLARMQMTGYKSVAWHPYTFGIAGLYRGRK